MTETEISKLFKYFHTSESDREHHYVIKPDSVVVDFYKNGDVVVLFSKAKYDLLISNEK